MTSPARYSVLWWGRLGNYGPDYPRNRTMRQRMLALGWEIEEFRPAISVLGDWQARVMGIQPPNLVWVPCFRQRDIGAAARWAKSHQIPLIIDPLISAYDKQVFERQKFSPNSNKARRLLRWEQGLFKLADFVIADTPCHVEYFVETLHCERNKVIVLPVSAEESLFHPGQIKPLGQPFEVLFFGTFIGLQGARYIADAIGLYAGPKIRLTFLGKGSELESCQQIAGEANNPLVEVSFVDWIPFAELADRIRVADICLGIFGTGHKAMRVIPNKVYQALACGKPVITMGSLAYPSELLHSTGQTGIHFCEPGNARSIADALEHLVVQLTPEEGRAAQATYQQWFSNRVVDEGLLGIQKQITQSLN